MNKLTALISTTKSDAQARKPIDKSRFLGSQLAATAEVWDQIKDSPYPADRWLGNYFHQHRKKFGSRDRRLIAETIYSLFRHKSFLEDWAQHLAVAGDSFFLVLAAARMEDLIPQEIFSEQIAKNCSNLRAPHDFSRILQKKELASRPPSQAEEIALKFSFPPWLVKRWTGRLGFEECLKLLETFQARPPLTVRANALKISREKLMKIFQQKGWVVFAAAQSPWGITFKERINLFDSEEFRQGYFEIQDEGSQLVCLELEIKPGQLVWDVCAGGGGKSLALAAVMENKGRIVATDIRQNKIADLKKRARRAGAHNIFPAALSRVSEIHAFRKGVDKILVDAPCSGTGTFRRNPDAKWKLKEGDFKRFQKDQLGIVENALPFLGKSGSLCYATCSTEPEENEDVVREILKRHASLELVPFGDGADGMKRLWPHRDGTDGFFLAILKNTQVK